MNVGQRSKIKVAEYITVLSHLAVLDNQHLPEVFIISAGFLEVCGDSTVL